MYVIDKWSHIIIHCECNKLNIPLKQCCFSWSLLVKEAQWITAAYIEKPSKSRIQLKSREVFLSMTFSYGFVNGFEDQYQENEIMGLRHFLLQGG